MKTCLKILATLAIASSAATALPARAAWPERPVTVVVPFPPGGPTDLVARVLAKQLADQTGQSFVVENKGGANGNIGMQYAASAKPDGYTVLYNTSSIALSPNLYRNLPFDPLRDFTPISMLANVPSVLVARKDFPVQTMPEFVSLVKANPGKYTMALGAIGSSLHMAGERMKMLAGLDILNVPYKGTSPAVTDLLGGQVDMMFASSLNALPHIKSGALKALGVTSPQALPQFPGVPPIGDTIKGFESNAWFALFGPAKLPADTLATLNAAARKAVDTPEFRQLLEREAAMAVSSSPQELDAFVRKDIERYAEIVKYTGATVD